MKKRLLVGLLTLASFAFAQDFEIGKTFFLNGSSGAMISGRLNTSGSAFLKPDLNFMAESESGYQDYSTGRRIGAGFLNMLFGVGSFTMGEWGHGLVIMSIEASAILILPGLFLNNLADDVGSVGEGGSNLFRIMGWGCIGLGAAAYVTGVVFGFIWPMDYHKPLPQTARLDDARNWQVAFYPDNNGELASQIAFTAHF
jgi:hypothetical protein